MSTQKIFYSQTVAKRLIVLTPLGDDIEDPSETFPDLALTVSSFGCSQLGCCMIRCTDTVFLNSVSSSELQNLAGLVGTTPCVAS